VREPTLARAQGELDAVLDRVAARYRDELAPAIERVWRDGVAAIRADLREWLRREASGEAEFVPWRFELAFGLPLRKGKDVDSVDEPVALDCGIRLRGAIDLLERSADGRLRVTDHKTGRNVLRERSVIAGGESLQPVLYALAAEKMFPDARVEAGRLYYCTSRGGFDTLVVPLDAAAREAAGAVADAVGAALAQPFLPALPVRGACELCDYAVVCGPYEALRTSRKPREHARVRELDALRRRP
jgi:CRISPR/Cas system-associated exonuclease Cas4 (RecB family)